MTVIEGHTYLPTSGQRLRFEATEFRDCVFGGGTFERWMFEGCRFSNCAFTESNLYRAQFEDCALVECRFNEVRFRKVVLRRTRFTHCTLKDSSFHRAQFATGLTFDASEFNGVEFGLGSAAPFTFDRCGFSGLRMDLGGNGPHVRAVWEFEMAVGNVAPFAFLNAEGLETCVDRDGSLSEAVGKLYLSLDDVEGFLNADPRWDRQLHEAMPRVREAFEALYTRVKVPGDRDEEGARVVSDIGTKLIQLVSRDPVAMYRITPREFEQLVASLMAEMKFEVTLTGCTRDGGYDIFAIKRDEAGFQTSWLVECKRWAPKRKVDLAVVRNLWTLRGSEQRGGAMVATTSTFSSDAIKYQSSRYDLALADHERILAWCRQYGRIGEA